MGRCYTRRPPICYSLRYRDGGDVAGWALAVVLEPLSCMHAYPSLETMACLSSGFASAALAL